MMNELVAKLLIQKGTFGWGGGGMMVKIKVLSNFKGQLYFYNLNVTV